MKLYTLVALSFIAGIITSSLFTCERELLVDRTNEAKLYTQLNQKDAIIKVLKNNALKALKEADSLHKEVSLLKKRKKSITYRTKFDTLVTIDTVIIELVKCDSVVKVSDSIIVKQDSVIVKYTEAVEELTDAITEGENMQVIQADIIKAKDIDLSAQKKELRKAKRKLFFTRVGIVAGGILLIFALAQ